MVRHFRAFLLFVFLLVNVSFRAQSQSFPFTSGPIPLCDTSTFTANVSGVGTLCSPGGPWWCFSLYQIGLNITTDHPEGLSISITSPQGTTLLLSAFNGAPGSNYTNCYFDYFGTTPITSGTAPFTGFNWMPQGPGGLSVFDGENADGTWTITVIDTFCTIPPPGPGGGPTAGWFNGGGAGNGGIAFGNSSPPPPPCPWFIPFGSIDVCPGTPVDILGYYTLYNPNLIYTIYEPGGSICPNPSAATIGGMYYIEGYDPMDGCFYSANYTINIYPQIVLGPDQMVAICGGYSYDLNSLFSFGGAWVNWSFNGTPISTAAASAAISPGTYQVVGSNPAGCNDTALVTLTLNPAPVLGPDQSVTLCPGNTYDLTLLFNTAGLISAWSYNGVPISNPTSATLGGSYMLVASDPVYGCTDTAIANLNLISGTFLGADQSVSGCITGAYDLTPLYNTTGLTTSWYLNGNPVANPAAVVANGTYLLVASDPSGCIDSATVTLNVNQNPNLGPDQTQSICSGSSVNLTTLYATGANTPAWYFGGVPFATPSSATNGGVYTLIVTSTNGCTDTAQVTLNIQSAPALGPDQFHSICTNATIDLTSLYTTTGFTTNWTYNGVPVPNPAAVNTTGTYTLVAAAGASCTDTALVTIAYSATPSLGPDANMSICSGSTLNLTTVFNTTGTTAVWTLNGNPVVAPASVANAGVYILIASGASGCADTAQVTLSVQPSPSLGPDQSVTLCPGNTYDLTLLFNTTGLNSSWSYNGIPIASPTSATLGGSYTLVATDPATGCTDTAVANMNLISSTFLGADQSVSGCITGNYDLTTLYNTTGLTTSWYLNGNPVANPAAAITNGTYLLVASDPSGCIDSATVTLNVSQNPNLGSDQTQGICSGGSVNLTTLYSTGANTPAWYFGGAPFASPSAATAAGVYTLVVTSPDGCTDTAQVTLNVQTAPSLGPDLTQSICSNTPLDLTTLYNTAGYTSVWTLNGVSVTTPNAAAATGSYMLVASAGGGCADTAFVNLTVLPAPSLGPDQSPVICAGTATDLNAYYSTAGLTIAWTENGNPVADPAAVSASGTYQLIATNASGCSDTALVSLTVSNGPSLGADQSFALCSYQTVDLSTVFNLSGLTATYSFNGTPITSYTAVYDSGTYAVQVTDANGCTDEALVIVTNVQCICAADFTYEGKCIQEPFTFEIFSDSAILAAHWSFGSPSIPDQYVLNPEVKFRSADSILVRLEVTLSCNTVVVEKVVYAADCSDSCHVFLPSAFTPNRDGINDTFAWKSECEPEQFHIEIFNRFGQVVFRSDDPSVSWDGTYNNTQSPTGVYVYTIEYRMPYQFKQVVSGKLNLIR